MDSPPALMPAYSDGTPEAMEPMPPANAEIQLVAPGWCNIRSARLS